MDLTLDDSSLEETPFAVLLFFARSPLAFFSGGCDCVCDYIQSYNINGKVISSLRKSARVCTVLAIASYVHAIVKYNVHTVSF